MQNQLVRDHAIDRQAARRTQRPGRIVQGRSGVLNIRRFFNLDGQNIPIGGTKGSLALDHHCYRFTRGQGYGQPVEYQLVAAEFPGGHRAGPGGIGGNERAIGIHQQGKVQPVGVELSRGTRTGGGIGYSQRFQGLGHQPLVFEFEPQDLLRRPPRLDRSVLEGKRGDPDVRNHDHLDVDIGRSRVVAGHRIGLVSGGDSSVVGHVRSRCASIHRGHQR